MGCGYAGGLNIGISISIGGGGCGLAEGCGIAGGLGLAIAGGLSIGDGTGLDRGNAVGRLLACHLGASGGTDGGGVRDPSGEPSLAA